MKLPKSESNKPGIYKITNLKDNKFYVGSARNVYRRIHGHLTQLNKNTHHSPHFQRAYNRYGIENFRSEILEVCDISSLIQIEQKYLDTLRPIYNVCKVAGTCLGIKRSKLAIEKQRK